eukprot:gene20690-23498_t
MLNILSVNKFLPLLRLEFRIKNQLCQSKICAVSEVQEAAGSFIAAYEYLFPYGHVEMLADLTSHAMTCCSGPAVPVLSPLQEKELCLKALRMRLLFKGRNNRDADLDDATARVLWKFPPLAIQIDFRMKIYQIKESTTRGKIVVAVRDIMPGELVVEEKEPVLYFTHAFYSQFDAGDTGLDKVLPAFSVFSKQLTSEKQQKLLSLFGPTTGQTAESIRNYARENMKYRFREDEEPRSMNSEELELFVKV